MVGGWVWDLANVRGGSVDIFCRPLGFLPSAFLPINPRTPKEPGFGGFRLSKLRRDTPFGLITPASACVMAKWHSRPPKFLAKTFRVNGFFLLPVIFFRQFKYILLLRELPGSVAGVYKWLLTPERWPFWCFLGRFVAKNPLTPTQEVRGAMTKPVAVFRSGVIGDSRHIPSDSMKTAIWCYFPLSAGIPPQLPCRYFLPLAFLGVFG
jgi:hypothetical protein